MGEMRDSDWSRPNLLRSDWLPIIVASMTTPVSPFSPLHAFLDISVSSSLSCFFCRVLRDFGSSGPGLAVEGLQSVRHCL